MICRGDWFLSIKGRQLYPWQLEPDDIDIEEIAHALSMICRFNGHCREFYSVAQHSIYVSMRLPADLMMAGLLHDSPEAYIGDMIRPLKRTMPDFCALEDGIWAVIAHRFGLPAELPPAVKQADTRMLQTERRDLLTPAPWKWAEDQIADDSVLPYPFKIQPWHPEKARGMFLSQYQVLVSMQQAAQAAPSEVVR